MEWAVEYFLPTTARFINGPALPEIEFEESVVMEPEGLQVLEELIYNDDPNDQIEIQRQLRLLKSKTINVATQFENITLNQAQLFDALRMSAFRLASLGIAGFDTPISRTNLKEAKITLNSLVFYLKFVSPKANSLRNIEHLVRESSAVLGKNSHPDNFNYAEFYQKFLNPICAEFQVIKQTNNIPNIDLMRALKQNAATFFSENAFDVNAFTPGREYFYTAEKARLGKKLFYDANLSGNGQRSCASCHAADKAFSDGLVANASLHNTPLPRNTPSLNYAAIQHGQFWDMRSPDLEGQSSDVISNKDEMHGNIETILTSLNAHKNYTSDFQKIFKSKKIERWQVENALATFIRSLAVFNSKFDNFMRGKENMTGPESAGFNLFVGKAKCGTCHFLPLTNGTVPPLYTKTEQEVLGVATTSANKKLDDDLGRGRLYSTVPSLRHSFKTPTLRNIDQTGPFMHNGAYKTLKEVVDFYNEGGGAGLGLEMPNQTLPADKLNLTKREKQHLITFLKTLTDH